MSEGKQEFHIGDVLSVTTGRLCPPNKMKGLMDLLQFLEGEIFLDISAPKVARKHLPNLEEQFPELTEEVLEDKIKELDKRLEKNKDNNETTLEWVEGIAEEYGKEQVEVWRACAE